MGSRHAHSTELMPALNELLQVSRTIQLGIRGLLTMSLIPGTLWNRLLGREPELRPPRYRRTFHLRQVKTPYDRLLLIPISSLLPMATSLLLRLFCQVNHLCTCVCFLQDLFLPYTIYHHAHLGMTRLKSIFTIFVWLLLYTVRWWETMRTVRVFIAHPVQSVGWRSHHRGWCLQQKWHLWALVYWVKDTFTIFTFIYLTLSDIIR